MLCISGFLGRTHSCLQIISTQQPVRSCENMVSGHSPSQHQWPHFSLCPLHSSLPLWLQFLFPPLLLVSQYTGFPGSLQTSSFDPASESLQWKYFHPRRPWGSLFHFLRVFAFQWGLFGHSVIVANLATSDPPSWFIFLHSTYNLLIYNVKDLFFWLLFVFPC